MRHVFLGQIDICDLEQIVIPKNKPIYVLFVMLAIMPIEETSNNLVQTSVLCVSFLDYTRKHMLAMTVKTNVTITSIDFSSLLNENESILGTTKYVERSFTHLFPFGQSQLAVLVANTAFIQNQTRI